MSRRIFAVMMLVGMTLVAFTGCSGDGGTSDGGGGETPATTNTTSE